ncbi:MULTISPECIES: hypothetical protein [unclassified Actinopolyspora]|uniref:hypothetical protein n=1 Tax=unclassified Actinopolyspora TaxID=2639451 RepID=UPI001F60AD16|nr:MULTISPECIES: hypothetical protein [unclassified Actinopolyspora]
MTAALLLTVAPVCAGAGQVSARPGASEAEVPAPRTGCTPRDERLSELSGLSAGPHGWYAVGDGGSALRVHEMDPRDCSVVDTHGWAVDPYDVEDLARTEDGKLWLADTGDNSRKRETVAVHVLSPGEPSTRLYRFRYPDGPHDAEALLLGRGTVPHIITKNPLGEAGIYRPAAEPSERSPVDLERVGTLSLNSTGTPGGPLPSSFGSVTVTGAAVSSGREVVAVRTYTEVYLYPAPNGGVLEALNREPLRVPLADEPQGEAIAFEPDGDLLSASEQLAPVRVVPDAVGLVVERGRGSGATGGAAGSDGSTTAGADSSAVWPPAPREVVLTAGAVFALLAVLSVVLRLRRRRGG